MLVLGRNIVHDRSTAWARDTCCETFPLEIAKYPSKVRTGVLDFVLKSEQKLSVLYYSTMVRSKQLVISKPVLDNCLKIDQIICSSLVQADDRRCCLKLLSS